MIMRQWIRRLVSLTILLLVSHALVAQPVAAQSNDGDDFLDVVERIYQALRSRDTAAQESFTQDHADSQPVLDRRPIRIVIKVVSAGAALVNLLPDRNDAELPGTSERSTQHNACGSVDGISLPCWEEYLGDGEGNESLPDYPYAKRPNGCSVPGAIPGANDTITLFFININFTDICNAHDRCYYTSGTTPRECNEPFEQGLRARCDEVIADHVESGWDIVTQGISVATALEACHTKADAMAMGVIGAQQISHLHAQIRQQRYLARVNAYVEQERAKTESD